MKILNIKNKKILDEVSLFLTKEEAIQLVDYLKEMIKDMSYEHTHLSSEDYQQEITIWVYDQENIEKLPNKVKKLLKEDVWEG